MYNHTNLAVAEEQDQELMFRFPDMEGASDFSREELEDDADGIRLSFPRAKIPGGGSTLFELPGEDSTKLEYVEKMVGVILYHHAANGYWVGEPNDEDKAPICASLDGKVGYGDPGGLCAGCSLNRFGSSEDGRGKACKNQRYLYLLQDGEFIPWVIYLPPTSLRSFSRFMNVAFLYRNRPSYGSVVELTLHREDKPTAHAVVDFRKVRDFSGTELARAKAFANAFRNQAKDMLQERAQAITAQQDNGYEYDGFGKKEKDGSFSIRNGAGTDMELDKLPL